MVRKQTFRKGIVIKPDNTALEGIEGEIKFDSADSKFKTTANSVAREIVDNSTTQSLTNKTIDVDNNTVSNIEVDNLKSGVLNTSSSLAGASNTQVPSALAAKDYADSVGSAADANLNNHINDTTDAHDASSISNVPAGTIAATDVQAAINELDGDIQAHLNDTTDAHDASAISNTPSGNLTATDVQAALNELQSDIDTNTAASNTNATNLTNHINNTTDAHDATAISVVPTGNLAATDVQAALVELQGDIDTINTSTIPTKVTGPSSATDEAIARFDTTTGKLIQNSLVTLSDAGVASGFTGISSSGTIQSTGVLQASSNLIVDISTDSTTTGANASVASPSTPFVRLTNTSLTSIDQILSPSAGRVVTIENATGNSIVINNDTGATASNRILTGTKSPINLADESSIIVKYDSVESRWMVIGGTGSGSNSSPETLFFLNGTDIAQWATGNNATFLGGGVLSGTFVANTSTPLNGVSSYSYTQAAGSLNDYIASPVQAVARRFRGTTCTLVFPFLYDGANNDIEVLIYDVTNAALIPSSTFIQASTTNAIFKTNVTIPLTCANIRIGFHVKVLNSGKILQFDDVQVTADNTIFVDQPVISELRFTGSSARGAVDTAIVKWDTQAIGPTNNGLVVQTNTANNGTVIRAARSGRISVVANLSQTSANAQMSITVNQVTLTGLGSASEQRANTQAYAATAVCSISSTFVVNAGDLIRIASSGAITSDTDNTLHIVHIADNTNILTVPDTFSTDTAALTYAGSGAYTLSTLANAPVGTFITFTYAANTNTRTQTTTAPTQTTADMNSNGILLYTRAYNSASTAAQPAAVAIQIGRGLKGINLALYGSSSKINQGSIDAIQYASTSFAGIGIKAYNEVTGILTIDAGYQTATTTSASFILGDTTVSTSGYLVINASKNPALTGLNISAVAARAVSSSGQSIASGGSGVTLTWDSVKTFDTNNALNTATGEYVVPESGYYEVSGAIFYSSSAWGLNQNAELYIYKNGVIYSAGDSTTQVAATFNIGAQITDSILCNKGDIITLRAFHNRGSATTLVANSLLNYFSIVKTSV